MLSEANFLILDEPTNHLDITSKEILEEALNRYTGTVLFVSHDRYFINKTATRILDLTEQTVVNYIGNYDYYLEKRDVQMQGIAAAGKNVRTEEKSDKAKLDWKQKKEEQTRIRKRETALKRAEEEIAEKEAHLQKLNEEMNRDEVVTDAGRLSEIHQELTRLSEELEKLYEVWEGLAEGQP